MTAAQALCQPCGQCCDGTLFGYATLLEHEDPSETVRAMLTPNTRTFPQPCQHFDKQCTIYADRPGVCRKFRCGVLRKLEAGELSHQDANRAVDLLRTRAALVRGSFGSGVGSMAVAARKELAALTETIQKGEAGANDHARSMLLAAFVMAVQPFDVPKKKPEDSTV